MKERQSNQEEVMNGRDWERFGDDIRRTVQDAIDTQDYAKLNQKITDTINEGMNQAAQSIKRFGESMERRSPGSFSAGDAKYRSPGSFSAGDAKYRSPESFSAGNEKYRSPGNTSAVRTMNPNRQSPALYEPLKGAKAGGVTLTALGYVIGLPLFLVFLVLIFGAFAAGDFGPGFQILAAVVGILTAAAGVMAWRGTLILGRIKRFRIYTQALKEREYCDVKELAEYTKKSSRYVAKDLEKMIAKGWFRQGHLDRTKSCLMVTQQAYEQYLQLEIQMRQQEEAKKQEERKAQEETAAKRARQAELSPEIQKIIAQGDEYVRKIRECNDAIPGEEISAKISRMETLVDRIFDRVEQNPDSVTDIRRLMEYYLPTTVKLLEAYEELDSQPVGGENIRAARQEIEATLDTLNSAFEKLLDDLFHDTAWDVSADISVLHTMLAQEGLTENEITKS